MSIMKKPAEAEEGSFVGRKVQKHFKGFGLFSGTVTFFDPTGGFYRVVYEDGDTEDMEPCKVKMLLVDSDAKACRRRTGDTSTNSAETSGTKRKRCEFRRKQGEPGCKRRGRARVRNDGNTEAEMRREEDEEVSVHISKRKKADEGSSITPAASGKQMICNEAEKFNYSEESERYRDDTCDKETECTHSRGSRDLQIPPLIPLPSSSGDFCLSDDVVVDVFSTYSFLRSFSRVLYLSPFGLQEFVYAIIADGQNNLVDSIHLCLLQSLRRHIQRFCKEGSKEAKNCLRYLDWNLLDCVTWPSFLVVFLATFGFSKVYGCALSSVGLLDADHYKVSPNLKLAVLRFLCDNVLDTDEVKAVLDSQELDWLNQSKQKEKRKLPMRFTADEFAEERTVQRTNHYSTVSLESESNVGQEQVSSDGNSDECALCGMDGSLTCCDSCPAAYHTRCVGISKTSLPSGDWYCPECIIMRSDGEQGMPVETFRGAQVLGVDLYGRSFLSTCGYLLVVEAKDWLQGNYKYYNKASIGQVLNSLEMLRPFCDDIIKAICQQWDIPVKTSVSSVLKEGGFLDGNVEHEGEARDVGLGRLVSQLDSSCSDCLKIKTPSGTEFVDSVSCSSTLIDDKSAACCKDRCDGGCVKESSENKIIGLHSASVEKVSNLGSAPDKVSIKHIEGDSTAHLSPQAVEMFGCETKEISLASASGIANVQFCNGLVDNQSLFRNRNETKLESSEFNKEFFTYVNHYVLGDVVATAAANLATAKITSFNRGVKKKTGTTTMAEQLKAFLKGAKHFFWPNQQRKFMELPKERCGWCHSCSNSSLKKGCLMNQAAAQLAAGAAIVAGGIRPTKSGSGHLPAVAGYMLHIEENLHGLLVGPWETTIFRKLWRKTVEQSVAVHDLKVPLLQLEENLRHIALIDDWSKGLEDAPIMIVGGPTSSDYPETFLKKSLSRNHNRYARRAVSRRYAGAFGLVQWSQRGKVAHRVSGWAILPSRVAKYAARQGGLKKIMGLGYSEGFDVPRRSRQYAWRARVQAACSISELAVQVRSLDAHIRWPDLLSKADVHHVGRKNEGFELCRKEIGAIHAKSLKENVPIYLVDTLLICDQDGQKNVGFNNAANESLQKEQIWVEEHELPLSLLKEFEEQDRMSHNSKAPKLAQSQMTYINGRKKISRRDVFNYLLERAGIFTSPKLLLSVMCKACSIKVPASTAVQCHMCKGPFHKECTNLVRGEGEKRACRSCFQVADRESQSEHSDIYANMKAVRVKLPLKFPPKVPYSNSERNESLNAGSGISRNGKQDFAARGRGAKGNNENLESRLQPKTPVRKTEKSDRVIWKKNAMDCRALNKDNILLPGQWNQEVMVPPKCFACKQQHRSDLLYVKCEFCPLWFHGDSIGVFESNLHEVAGFKCHKCRKKSAPLCPYNTKAQKHMQTPHKAPNCDDGEAVDVLGGIHRSYLDNNRAYLATVQEQSPGLVSASDTVPIKGNSVDPLFDDRLSVGDYNISSPSCHPGAFPEVVGQQSRLLSSHCSQAGHKGANCLITHSEAVHAEDDVSSHGRGELASGDCTTVNQGSETGENIDFTIEEVMELLYSGDVEEQNSGDPCSRAPFAFSELLSSEDNWVDTTGDFDLKVGGTSHVYVGSVGERGTSLLFPGTGGMNESVRNNTVVAESVQDTAARGNGGGSAVALHHECNKASVQCTVCGMPAYEQGHDQGSWSDGIWTCDVCKAGSM